MMPTLFNSIPLQTAFKGTMNMVTTLNVENAPPAFHLLVKPTGAICNLDCKYCFFLSKEMLYPGSRFRMADDLVETYIKHMLETGKPLRN